MYCKNVLYIYAYTNICLLYACANRYFFPIFYLSLKLARKESLFPKRYPLKIRDKTNGRRTKRVQKKHARCRGEWNAEPDSDSSFSSIFKTVLEDYVHSYACWMYVIYECTCMYLCMYVYVSLWIRGCICPDECVHICISVWRYVRMRSIVNTHICLYCSFLCMYRYDDLYSDCVHVYM
jgi:hypothetical protein